MSLQQVLAVSDVVIGAVPVAEYKIKTAWLKDGCVAVNVAQEKNFEADVREKVTALSFRLKQGFIGCFYSLGFTEMQLPLGISRKYPRHRSTSPQSVK
jgi:hypothetical protein